MPWEETSTVDERLEFVKDYQAGLDTMTELCDRFGISRQTGYKWLGRYETGGVLALQDQSRRPHHRPRTIPPAVVEALLAARRQHPTWGPKKLLSREGGWRLSTQPARSTASAILKQHGLVRPVRRRPRPGHPGRPVTPMVAPNGIWTIDFKGQFRTGDRTYCYPLTVIDGFSRFVLACHALSSVHTAPTRAVLERVFREYGLPDRLRSDNGVPFATSRTVARLSALAVWWIRLGIVPELIEPGCPAQNGRHERFHRTLKLETTMPPAATRAAQQRRFKRFREAFNTARPHEALDQRPPAAFYQPSRRPYPRTLPPLDYASHYLVRRVAPSGSITWHNVQLFISHVLVGEDVGLTLIDDGRWAVYFGPILLGHFDAHHQHVQPVTRMTGGRSLATPARA